MMRLPWIKRSDHERIVSAFYHTIDANLERTALEIVALNIAHNAETKRLRQDLLAEQNAHAVTRGRLVAEAHARGEPAP